MMHIPPAAGQTPGAHATTHQSGGSDPIKLDDLAAPNDNTDLDTNAFTHGLAPKSISDASKFLNGASTPAFSAVKDSDLSTSDITTNNVSTTKHGFAPKVPNDTQQFLRGDAAFAIVPGRFLARTVLTSGTSFTTGANVTKIRVRLVAGGGGGGGAASTGAGAAGGAGGGGGGGYAEKDFTVSVSTAYIYAVGAGGAGGVAGNNAGSAGGNTTFTVGATTVTAFGGSGADGCPSSTVLLVKLGGPGGVVSTNGDVNATGNPGNYGFRVSGTVARGGPGGESHLGGGGVGISAQGTGSTGGQYGGGGGGACALNADQAGGDGAGGVIIVDEYS